MNKITRFKQRRVEAKLLRADEAIIHNAKAMLSFHEQIDVATARYLSGELCLSEMADEVNRIARSLTNDVGVFAVAVDTKGEIYFGGEDSKRAD